MIKLNIKVEGLDKLESELRKEGDKLIKEELRKQKAKHQTTEDDDTELRTIDSELEVISSPKLSSTPTVSSSPKISSGLPLRKKP